MSLSRKVLLAMSTSTFLREQATRRAFVRKSVSAFMPGEKVEDALAAASTLKPQRINTILTRLGEGVTRLDEAERVTQHYLDVLDKVQAAGLDAQISVKPTQLVLDLDATHQTERRGGAGRAHQTQQHPRSRVVSLEPGALGQPALVRFQGGAGQELPSLDAKGEHTHPDNDGVPFLKRKKHPSGGSM